MGQTSQGQVYSWLVKGQPTPAPRLTQARKFDVRLHRQIPSRELAEDLADDARRAVITRGYYAFKGAVVAALLDAYPFERMFVTQMLTTGWPFGRYRWSEATRAIMEYSLWMAQTRAGKCVHGDPDNIAKAILDALFGDDRHVMPRCQGIVCGDNDPRVTITVMLL